ncbi:MAG: hypothetical protein H0X41_05625 [Chitinophagaceae bacterium]|nr:hypothetical protein [Chitinophagaceae bacterium]
MKYSQPLGVLATIILMVSGFLHWAWYPDLQKYFTGFFSENDIYGKPGKVFLFLGVIAIVLFLAPRVWAKRGNIFLCAIIIAYAVKSFILFSGCYKGICPVKQPGIWLMLGSAILMLLFSLFPDTTVRASELPE